MIGRSSQFHPRVSSAGGPGGRLCHLTHSFAASAAVCFQKSIQEQGFSQSYPSLKAKFPLEKPNFGKIIS